MSESNKAPRGPGLDPRSNVLGVGISVLNLASATDRVFEALGEGRRGYVCVTGVHGVMEAQGDPEFRRMLNDSFLTTPDGMPMVWMGKINGFKQMDRVYGPDLMAEVCRRSAETGNTHYLYGGGDGVVEDLATALEERFPGIRILGKYTPPFRPLNDGEESELIAELAEKKPDFFWVGLSTPKQERFMDAYLGRLETRIMFGVGAAFDFHAGKVKQAPRWIQRSGFEWLYRTCKEPRRLWKRYAVNNTRFLYRISLQLLHLRKTPLSGQ